MHMAYSEVKVCRHLLLSLRSLSEASPNTGTQSSLFHHYLNLESDDPLQFLYGFCSLIEPYFRLSFLYDSWMSEKAHVHYFATHSSSS